MGSPQNHSDYHAITRTTLRPPGPQNHHNHSATVGPPQDHWDNPATTGATPGLPGRFRDHPDHPATTRTEPQDHNGITSTTS